MRVKYILNIWKILQYNHFLFLHRTTCAHSDMHYASSVACEGWLVRLFSTELGGQTTSSADHHRPSLWLNTTTLTSAMHYCTKYTRIPEHHQSHCIAPHLTFGAPWLVAPRFCKQTCTKVLHKVLHQSLPSKLAPESGDQISPYFAKKKRKKNTLMHQGLALGILQKVTLYLYYMQLQCSRHHNDGRLSEASPHQS